MSTTDSFCPYVGLQPFTEKDSAYFFGRERDQRIITSNLYAAPLTLLYGASGVGKSSILMAGLVPFLRAKPRTAVVVFRDWQNPTFFSEFKLACARAIEAVQKKPSRADIHLPLDDFLGDAAAEFHGSILILLDQFEEYFLYHPEMNWDDGFDIELVRAINREDVEASFLIALREDGLSKMDRYRGRILNLLGNTLRLTHLDAAAAENAIRKPLDVFNARYPERAVTIEDALVKEIIAQVRTGQVSIGSGGTAQAQKRDEGATIETPFLQLVLTHLWDEEFPATGARMPTTPGVTPRVLRAETLTRLGGADRIVRTHLDQVMTKLSPVEQAVCSSFFDRLVTPSGTKIAQTSDDLVAYSEQPADTVLPILKMIADARVLRTIAPPMDRPKEVRYEIFHDVLAPAILDWRRRFAEKQMRERSAREEREKRAKLIRRLAVVVGTILLLVFSGLTLFALNQADLARKAESQALIQRDIAATAEVQANRARATSESLRKESSAREIAFSALASIEDDPERSILLAMESLQTNTREGVDALREALANSLLRVTLRGHVGRVYGVAFSPDGTKVATAGEDKTARIWESETGKEIQILKGHTDIIRDVAFSPDGTHIATAGVDKTIRIWEVVSGKELSRLDGHAGTIRIVNFSPDGSEVITASLDGTARIWDALRGIEIKRLTGHSSAVASANFSYNGKEIVTASLDQTARIWNAETGELLLELPHSFQVNSAAFSPDGKRIVTAGTDSALYVWDRETGRQLQIIKGHKSTIVSVTFSSDGNRLISTSLDLTARVFDSANGRIVGVLAGHKDNVLKAVINKTGSLIATASIDGTARLWKAPPGEELLTLAKDSLPVKSADYSSDGSKIVTASADGTARIWDANTGNQISVLKSNNSQGLYHASFSPDQRSIVTASSDGTASIWNSVTGELMATLRGHKSDVYLASYSPDGRKILTASADGTARLWNAASPENPLVLSGQKFGMRGATFSPDGTKIVTGNDDTSVWVWNSKGEKIGELVGHRDAVAAISFSADGKKIVTASYDKTIRIWDATLFKELLTLRGHSQAVSMATFSGDGRNILSSSFDQTVRFWDAQTGEEVDLLRGYHDAVYWSSYSPDGKKVLIASNDGTARVSLILIQDLLKLAKSRVTRELTCDERERYLRETACAPSATSTPKP